MIPKLIKVINPILPQMKQKRNMLKKLLNSFWKKK